MFSSNSNNNNNNNNSIDTETIRKAKKTCDKITESIYVAANEPTLACFRIQEHVHRSVPVLIDKKSEMVKNENNLKGLLYDVEYTKESIESLRSSKDRFDSIHKLLKDAIFFKQQADYEENIRRRVQEKVNQQSKPKAEVAGDTTNNPRIRPSSSNANRFNRFSTSFDFSNAIPSMVASSVSVDIKSLINQLTSKDKDNQNISKTTITENSSNSGTTTNVSSSKSLHTLPENLDDNETNPESSNIEKKKTEDS